MVVRLSLMTLQEIDAKYQRCKIIEAMFLPN